MSAQMLPVVVIGTHTVGLGVIRALAGLKVPIIGIHYDPRDMGYFSNYLSEQIHAPHPEQQEYDFISFLRGLSTRVGQSLLIPTSDASLKVVSRYKSELAQNYIVACVEWEIAESLIHLNHLNISPAVLKCQHVLRYDTNPFSCIQIWCISGIQLTTVMIAFIFSPLII